MYNEDLALNNLVGIYLICFYMWLRILTSRKVTNLLGDMFGPPKFML